ncbi:hypothetical protein KZP23_08700 [Echinicola marina]|uniref:hypothetical protein n=1 Tax=Echinicola marina TaxID=2859768 RepID=UPI001CF65586|nr:hypothetical protein [Echinicola marina]UCS95073.1 hypothetical protein KZP23_08700 [Echinicola marina]
MRLIIASLVALCISGSAFAYSAGQKDLEKEKDKKSTVVLEKTGDKKVQLKFLTEPNGKIMVRIKDARNALVYKEIIKTDKEFKKSYDLSALAEGDYEFEVFTREEGTIDNFEVSLGKAKAAGSNYFAKVKVIDDENVALLVKTKGESKKTIRILDQGHVVFEDSFEGENYGKLFKLKKVESLKDLVFEVRGDDGNGKFLSAL